MVDITTQTDTPNSTPTQAPEAPTGANPEPASSTVSSTTAQPTDAPKGTLLTGEPGDAPKPEAETGTGEPASPDATTETPELFGAPEAYELTLPEGVELDRAALDVVSPIAKELNLSNAGLGKLAEAYTTGILPRIEEAFHAQLNDQVKETQTAWATETKTFVEEDRARPAAEQVFGGDDLAKVQSVAAKALDRLAGPEFRAFLDETGIGNRKEMVLFAYRAGKAISEDTSFPTSGAPVAPKSREERYYGS
jgi:hypothetical protein